MIMVFSSLRSSANQILIKIKGDDKDFQNALKKSDKSMVGFASKMKTYGPMIGAAFGAAAAGAVAYSLKIGVQHDQLKRGFHSLAASQGKDADMYIKKLKEMSHGTVSELKIMQKANQAMLLGLDLDTITKMMEGATIIAQATGQDVAFMFESMALGVARQSPMILDNLGIIMDLDKAYAKYAKTLGITVNQLSDSQKAIAFTNEAMDGMETRMDAVGDYTETAATKMATFEASVSDAAVAFSDELLPELTTFLTQLTESETGMDSWVTKAGTAFALPFKASNVAQQLKPLEKELEMIKNIEAGGMLSTAGEQRKHEVIVEMQRIQNAEKIADANQKSQEWMEQYSNAAHTAANLEYTAAQALIEKLRIEKEILAVKQAETAELEKQLTLEQMAAQINLGVRSRGGFGGATMSAATAESLGVSDANISSNITSSVRSGV